MVWWCGRKTTADDGWRMIRWDVYRPENEELAPEILQLLVVETGYFSTFYTFNGI